MKQNANHNKYDCADIEKLVQRYIDGVLSKEEEALFDEHIEYCLPCDKKVEFEQKLKEVVHLKSHEKEIPTEQIKSRLDRFLKEVG